jgi:hypothetical protein
MEKIPNRIQCAYCIRHYSHGGECQGKKTNSDIEGCLVFKIDEKGCIRNSDFKIGIPLYRDFPLLNTWCDNWQIYGVDTELRVKKIYGFKWNTKTGELIVNCNCDYYINEYHENYEEPKNKTIFKIIK